MQNPRSYRESDILTNVLPLLATHTLATPGTSWTVTMPAPPVMAMEVALSQSLHRAFERPDGSYSGLPSRTAGRLVWRGGPLATSSAGATIAAQTYATLGVPPGRYFPMNFTDGDDTRMDKVYLAKRDAPGYDEPSGGYLLTIPATTSLVQIGRPFQDQGGSLGVWWCRWLHGRRKPMIYQPCRYG